MRQKVALACTPSASFLKAFAQLPIRPVRLTSEAGHTMLIFNCGSGTILNLGAEMDVSGTIMSDIALDDPDRLNIREQIARIDRTQAEIGKLVAEQSKLTAEAAKFRRERLLAPILAAAALGGFIAAIIPSVLRSWGVH